MLNWYLAKAGKN